MKKHFTILIAMVLMLLSCSNDYLKYDDNGKISKIEDPGDYTTMDKLLIHLGCHNKTDKIIAYSEYLTQENFQRVAINKINSVENTDSSYWFASYSAGFLYSQNNAFDEARASFLKALEQYDGDKEWAGSTIGKENIYRNLCFSCYMLGCSGFDGYNDEAIDYGQQAILLSDENSEERRQAIYLVSQAYLNLKQYEEASFWIGEIEDKNLAERVREYYKKEEMHNDSIDKKLFPDWPLFYRLKSTGHYSKTYDDFIRRFTENAGNEKELFDRLVQNHWCTMTFSEFHDLYFAYYDNYQAYLKPVKLDIKLIR